MTSPKRVAVLPGDDAAPEAVHAALELLDHLGLAIEWVTLPDSDAMV